VRSYVGVSMSGSTHVYKEGFLLRVICSSSFSLMQPLVSLGHLWYILSPTNQVFSISAPSIGGDRSLSGRLFSCLSAVLSAVLCPLSSVLCPLSSVLCPLSSVLCPLSSVLCPRRSLFQCPPSLFFVRRSLVQRPPVSSPLGVCSFLLFLPFLPTVLVLDSLPPTLFSPLPSPLPLPFPPSPSLSPSLSLSSSVVLLCPRRWLV